MELEEHEGVEPVEERCQECGVRLTPEELEVVLENGGPPLCTTHAAEVVPVSDEEADKDGGEPF